MPEMPEIDTGTPKKAGKSPTKDDFDGLWGGFHPLCAVIKLQNLISSHIDQILTLLLNLASILCVTTLIFRDIQIFSIFRPCGPSPQIGPER